MDDLIEALTIFRKYINLPYPTTCEHGVLVVAWSAYKEMDEVDIDRLDHLSFSWSNEYDGFVSYRFGSC